MLGGILLLVPEVHSWYPLVLHALKTPIQMRVAPFLLLYFFLFSTHCMAQRHSMVDSLLHCGLVKKKQRKDAQEILKGASSASKSSVISSLLNVERRKILGRRNPIGMVYYSFGEEELPPSEWASIRTELRARLAKLQACSFVSPSIASLAAVKIDSNHFRHHMQLLHFLYEEESKKEWLSPVNVLPFIEKLNKQRILSDEKRKKLEVELQTRDLESNYEMVAYCEHARLFDLAKYSDDPAIYVEQIHQEVAALLPQLAFSDFSWKIVLDSVNSSEEYKSYDLLVSLVCQGRTYEQTSFISPECIGKADSFFGKIGTQEFYEIFNKVLADLQSPKRLHLIQSQAYGDSRYFGIIALDKEQEESLHSSKYFPTSYEDFHNTLTTQRIEEAIVAYRSLGLFQHLSEAQIQQGRELAKRKNPRNLNQVLLLFPSVVYFFDSEMPDLNAPYKSILEHFSLISHNIFSPANIVDEFNKPTKEGCLVKFSLKGKDYSKQLLVESDWVDPGIFGLIDEAVTEQKLPGSFHYLLTEGQELSYVFLSPSQYEELRAKKWLVFEEED